MAGLTCSALVKKMYDYFVASRDVNERKTFFAGFWAGQAEKVFLGACRAAMFRPSPDDMHWAAPGIAVVAESYELAVTILPCYYGDEIWISRPEEVSELERLAAMSVDSPRWHLLRGALCGVSADEIDLYFHNRRGREIHCD